jgi:hypothetical protein
LLRVSTPFGVEPASRFWLVFRLIAKRRHSLLAERLPPMPVEPVGYGTTSFTGKAITGTTNPGK